LHKGIEAGIHTNKERGQTDKMGNVELGMMSIGLAMDAFAVAICKGLCMKRMQWKKAGIIALYFGIFQAGMPIIGYGIGIHFINMVEHVDHWIAFAFLSIIGIKMIKEAYEEKEKQDDRVDWKTMLVLALATSIDALAVGITLAILETNIAVAASWIGCITFGISFIGVKIGNVFGNKYEKLAQIIGGGMLILMGVNIVIEHIA